MIEGFLVTEAQIEWLEVVTWPLFSARIRRGGLFRWIEYLRMSVWLLSEVFFREL